MSQYDFILDGMNWSFSSVRSYDNCPYGFKLSYIDRKSQRQNAFAQWGTFCHSILEKYFKGEYDLFDLVSAYEDGYRSAVTEIFPPNKYVELSDSYYKAGIKYFSEFSGLDNVQILAIEKKVQTVFEGYNFVGVIDLIYKDLSTGDIIIQDHKSKKEFKNKTEEDEYLRQLYLYSKFIKDTFHVNPKELHFNMIRGGKTISRPYIEEEYQEAIKWFVDTIKKIYADTEFQMNYNDFFCHNLCGVREHCIGGEL